MIKKILARPYHLFLLIAIMTLLVAIFFRRETIDIHLHDTYFVIQVSLIHELLAFYLILVWILYHLTFNFLLSKVLIWVHLLSVISLPLLVIYTYNSYNPSPESLRRYYDYSNYESFKRYSNVKAIMLVAIVTLQALCPLNLIAGMIRHSIRSLK